MSGGLQKIFGLLLVPILFSSYDCAAFFVAPSFPVLTRSLAVMSSLNARKKASKAKGFGKSEPLEPNMAESSKSKAKTSSSPPPTTVAQEQTFLQSVESGGSDALPAQEELPPEERAKKILREKYGMKSLEEQQLDAKQLESMQERRSRMNEWKQKADENEDFDIIAMLPAPLLFVIDRFLKAGVAVTGLLFIAAGLGITLEAWSKTTGNPLPENVDQFIVETVEPNFTKGLVVLLGFSVSLGTFAAAQLGSAGAQYKEDD